MTLPSSLWSSLAGRELDVTPIADRASPARVVACLNVWNDQPALIHSVPKWRAFVDHVIVVDGSYGTIGSQSSTDGTLEYLKDTFPSIEILGMAGSSQCEKRTAYLERGQDGDYLFVIDADEHVLNPQALRNLPNCDIGWVRMRSALYAREYGQPRIFKWRPGLHYAGRHHWMYERDRLFCTHQYGGPCFVHRPTELTLSNERSIGRNATRQSLKRQHLTAQSAEEAPMSSTPRSIMSDSSLGAREALWILNYAYRDDGIAPSRFHSAINRTTPHSSVMFKMRPGPFGVPTQYDARKDGAKLATAIGQADVAHFHGVVSMARQITRPMPHVFHHHGSLLRANAQRYTEEAKRKGALVLVSNLELLSHTGDYPAFFLPNVVPVARYRALAQENASLYDSSKMFRIGHSPTHAHRKGTKEFLAACTNLSDRGFNIEPVLMEHQSHADTLFVKTTCHAFFDSFWLGMQCSGLEAAAMGMPVIAGDHTVAARYRQNFGVVPYTFANNQEELEFKISQLIEDESFRLQEADRVNEYVCANHDESAVALTYLDYLDMAFQWRTKKRKNGALNLQSSLRLGEGAVR